MEVAGLQLPGYDSGDVLWRHGGRMVLRAVARADGVAVAVETLEAEYPDRQQVAEIRREFNIAQRLFDVEGVRRVYRLLSHGNGNLALVGELFEGTLASYLERKGNQGLAPLEALEIALHLARTLGEVHARDLVHKAVAPQHVQYDPVTGRLALAGFGIASELDQERQALQMSQRVEGPLPYISPEQTGRMNRDLDYRSDFYSLGVLLFELLTGVWPFSAANPLEWVHSHISRLPPAPHEIAPGVPEAVSAIVLKLLAKSPESRYQSSVGLVRDLTYCADRLASGREMGAFEPGEWDVAWKFLVPQNLYGREDELRELLGLFESVAAGQSEFCLVHGYSGVGKSALVNELDRRLVRQRGFLVQGKFEQFQQGAAYTALAGAFRGLVQQVLAESEERLARWRQGLQAALGSNAALVVDLVPELELIIGPQPDVAELPPAEARNRLHIVLTHFLGVFAGDGHPLVLFLDDLQWSDAPTLELLRRLATTRELRHLLMIGAYRSNEVGLGHPLHLMLDELKSHRSIHQLPLGPLGPDAVAKLVADALYRDPGETRPLSDMLYDKAQGNPFFTNELLRQLRKEGAITLDQASGVWHWDLDAVRWSGVSSDVVEFMVDNLRRFPAATQQALQMAACIGGTFDLHTLAAIYQHSIAETAQALLPALKRHTLMPLHNDYRFVGVAQEEMGAGPSVFNPSYRFQHDRIQQAAYALFDSERLPEVHLSVGRLMRQHAGEAVPDDRVIDIVGHFNEGRALLLAEERYQLAELNLRAGVLARRSTAYEAARHFLHTAVELLPEEPWLRVPELMRPLTRELQQCAYLTGHIDEAEEWLGILLERAASDLERSEILATCTRQYATLGRMDDSIASAIKGLALLGVDFNASPDISDIAEEKRLVEVNLAGRTIPELVDAPEVVDPAILGAMRLLMEIFAAAFLSGSGNLFPYLVLKAVNLTLRHGSCPESAFIHAAYGMLLCGELDDPATGYQHGRLGLAINERFDDVTLRARVIYVYAMFVHHWNNHWASLTPWFRKGIEAGYQSGDLLYLAYSAQDCVIWDPTLDLEQAQEKHAQNMEIVRECAYQDSFDSGSLFLQLQRNLLGLTTSPCGFSDEIFDVRECLAGMQQRQFMTGIANYHIYSAEVCLLYGQYDNALMHIHEQDRLITSAMSLPQLVRYYIVAFLTLATLYPEMSAEEQACTRTRMLHDLARMTRWADNCEENFRHLQLLMEAELARLDGARESALEQFDCAIDAARASGFLRDEATACERTARHLLALGRRRAAEGYLRSAHHLYERWGARRKVNLLEQEFPVLRELSQAGLRPYLVSEGADLDLTSLMKTSRIISGEIVLHRLLETTMAILLENAGGQWGCLVLRRDGRLRVEAAELPEHGRDNTGVPSHFLIGDDNGRELALPVTLFSQVLHSTEALVLRDAGSEGEFVLDPYVRLFKPVSVLCVPLRRKGLEGVLYIENNLAAGVFTEQRVEVMRHLGAQALVAIENARLYEQVQDYSRTLEEKVAERTARLEQLNGELQRIADRDGLTGVANRRKGDAYLEEVWMRLRRERHPLSVIMLDVDHFKAYNDNYGHQAGDDCLVAVAETVRAQLQRPSDMVARYGGEEFIVILPDTDLPGAAQVGEKIRQAVESLAITHARSSAAPVVTISAGAATLVPDVHDGIEHLMREADIALYRAKRMGRNQVQSVSAMH